MRGGEGKGSGGVVDLYTRRCSARRLRMKNNNQKRSDEEQSVYTGSRVRELNHSRLGVERSGKLVEGC